MENRPPVVGDVFYTSWGYDQTQVEFYKVVALTPSGKSVRVQQVWAKDVSTGDNPHRSLVPTVHKAEDDNGVIPATTHVLLKGGTTAIKVDGHHAWLWDGKPKYATGHGYGH